MAADMSSFHRKLSWRRLDIGREVQPSESLDMREPALTAILPASDRAIETISGKAESPINCSTSFNDQMSLVSNKGPCPKHPAPLPSIGSKRLRRGNTSRSPADVLEECPLGPERIPSLSHGRARLA